MDEIDVKIVDILLQDARTPFTKIAEKIGVGTDTVIRRYQKLIETEIISKPTIVLDSKLCGFAGIVDYYIKVQPNTNLDKIFEKLCKIRNFVSVCRVLGDVDILCSGFFADFKDLSCLTRAVKKIDNLRSIDLSIYVSQDWTIPLSFEFDAARL